MMDFYRLNLMFLLIPTRERIFIKKLQASLKLFTVFYIIKKYIFKIKTFFKDFLITENFLM